MRRSLRALTLPMALLAALLANVFAASDARAQAVAVAMPLLSQVEIFGGYSSIGAKTVGNGPNFRLQGVSLSAAGSVSNWLSVMGAVGFYRQGNIAATGIGLSLQTYQIGARANWRNGTHLTPFGELLVGGGNVGGSLYTRSLGFGMPPLGPNNGLLLTAGGGVDWRVRFKVKIRLVEVESLQSHFLNGSRYDSRQSNLKLSTGVVFSFSFN